MVATVCCSGFLNCWDNWGTIDFFCGIQLHGKEANVSCYAFSKALNPLHVPAIV
jgi:hypothetical protein